MIKVGKVGLKKKQFDGSLFWEKNKGDRSTLLPLRVSVRFISNFQLTRKWG